MVGQPFGPRTNKRDFVHHLVAILRPLESPVYEGFLERDHGLLRLFCKLLGVTLSCHFHDPFALRKSLHGKAEHRTTTCARVSVKASLEPSNRMEGRVHARQHTIDLILVHDFFVVEIGEEFLIFRNVLNILAHVDFAVFAGIKPVEDNSHLVWTEISIDGHPAKLCKVYRSRDAHFRETKIRNHPVWDTICQELGPLLCAPEHQPLFRFGQSVIDDRWLQAWSRGAYLHADAG